MKNKLIVNFQKILIVYGVGFISAFALPEKYFFGLMNIFNQKINEELVVIEKENYYKLINEVSTCIVKKDESCKETPNLCAVTENGSCNLILPEKNLITKKENEPIYYGRMADELIRYNRIKSFMLLLS